MDHVQPHQMRKKQAVGARFEGLRAESKLHPQTKRLRIDALRDALDPAERSRQSEGTRQRVQAGKATEPLPRPKP